jgi:hypothetical protein
MLLTKFVEKNNTHFKFNDFFSKNCAIYEIIIINRRLYSPGWTLASLIFRFLKNIFLRGGVLASRPTPNLEDQVIPICLGHHP